MTDEKVMFSGRIDPELKDLIDASPENNQDVLNAALWQYFGGRKKSALEAKKQHKLEQKKAIKKSIESEEKDLQRVEREIEAIEAQLEKVEEREDEQAQALDDLLDYMVDEGAHLFPEHGKVQSLAADYFGGDVEEALDTLKERAEERDLGIPDKQFESNGGQF